MAPRAGARHGVPMEYLTVRGRSSAAFTEKRSKFIATLAPAASTGDAEALFEQLRASNPGARHCVTAYVLTGGSCHSSDDGEPQGTAGAPVLAVLTRRGLQNTAAVVVRYFGGVLLGAPGLVRAYSRAAVLAADAAETVVMRRCAVFRASVGYTGLAQLEHRVRAAGGVIRAPQYGARVTLEAVIPEERAGSFGGMLRACDPAAPPPEPAGLTFCPAALPA